MKSLTLPHLVGYLVAGLVWLASLDPSLAATVVGPQLAPFAGALITLAGAIVLFLHQTGWIPTKPAETVKTVAKVFVPLLLVLPFLHGCATLTKVENALSSPSAQPYLTAAADVAVATAEAKGVTAAQITTIAQQALAADQGTAATLATIAAAANAQIAKLGLPAGDVQAAQILEAALTVAIQAQIGGNASIAQAQAAIATVLNAILAAANPSAPAPASSAPPAVGSGAVTLDVPAQNTHFALSSVESPQVVGASASLVLIACLQAFAHLSVNAPTGAAITVLFTVGAAAIDNLIG